MQNLDGGEGAFHGRGYAPFDGSVRFRRAFDDAYDDGVLRLRLDLFGRYLTRAVVGLLATGCHGDDFFKFELAEPPLLIVVGEGLMQCLNGHVSPGHVSHAKILLPSRGTPAKYDARVCGHET